MPLVELTPETSDWHDIKHAALILWKASQIPDVTALQNDLRNHYTNSASTTIGIHTLINRRRTAVVVHNHETIIIAFQGSADDEIHKNLWTDGKGSEWWNFPYWRYVKGNRVHNFYLDMWSEMENAVFSALYNAIATMQDHDMVPKKLIIAGHSMGGGVSTLAFTDIIEHIRDTYGSQCSSPQDWASDHNLGSLIQHLTFASTGAGDKGYLTLLNRLYERYQIRAWDFWNFWDGTRFSPHFTCWRGHCYFLSYETTHQFRAGFGPLSHWIQGYYQAVEWMAEYGLYKIVSAYPSGYA